MDAPTIELGNCSATLVHPRKFFVYSMFDADVDSLMSKVAAGCAALRMCWPTTTKQVKGEEVRGRTWPTRPVPKEWGTSQSVLDYGSEVFDALIETGYKAEDVTQAAFSAYSWAVSTVVSDQEIQQATGNSEAPEGAE